MNAYRERFPAIVLSSTALVHASPGGLLSLDTLTSSRMLGVCLRIHEPSALIVLNCFYYLDLRNHGWNQELRAGDAVRPKLVAFLAPQLKLSH